MSNLQIKEHDELFLKLKQLIRENPEETDLIKKAISLYIRENHFIRDHYCDICDKRLTENERATIGVRDFLITCHQHRQHANKYQVDLVREQLELPPRTFFLDYFIKNL